MITFDYFKHLINFIYLAVHIFHKSRTKTPFKSIKLKYRRLNLNKGVTALIISFLPTYYLHVKYPYL